MYRVWTPSLGGVWTPQVHAPCAHNLVAGLLARTMSSTPGITPQGVLMYRRATTEVIRVLRGRVGAVQQWSFDQVVASYVEKRLRVRYEEAHRSLLADGLCVRDDARVKAFVKGEKLARYKVHKPRVIMGRSPRYNLELASYLKPIEHAVYPQLRGWGKKFFTHTRLIGKGLNQKERAALIRKKLSSFPGLVCFEIDGKSFESHFTREVLRDEHRVYTTLLKDRRLRKLLRWQEEFDGSGCGVRFHVDAVRASGDFNTGLGNTLVMCCLVLASAYAVGKRFDFLADGDNAIIFVRDRDVSLWREELPVQFRLMGFEVQMENPVSELAMVPFGQSKPCCVVDGWTMVRDPFKVLSHAACGYRHYGEIRGGLRVLKSVAYCEAVLNAGVPVLQEYAHALLAATRHVAFSKASMEDYQYQQILSKGVNWELAVKKPITASARSSFWLAWGVSVEEQLRMERVLARGFCPPSEWPAWLLEEELPDGRDHWTLVGHPLED